MSGGNGGRMRPGEVNAHTHIYSGLAPLGMPAPPRVPSDFRDILGLVWWKLDRALDEASLRASARYYAAHALLHGTTTLVDHHESPRFIEGSLHVIADACQELGIHPRFTPCPIGSAVYSGHHNCRESHRARTR